MSSARLLQTQRHRIGAGFQAEGWREPLCGEHAIAPGGLHWTLAGRGVMHDECPTEPGREAHGLEISVNMPGDQKLRAPTVMRVAPEQMPRRVGEGWRAVQVFGADTALDLPSPTSLVLLDIEAGARVDLTLPEGEQGFAIAISIHGRGHTDELPLFAGRALSLPAGRSWRRCSDSSRAAWAA